jgi:hypothetical protein
MLKLTSSRGNKNATKHMPKDFMKVLFYTHQESGIGNPFKETIQARQGDGLRHEF